MLNGGRNFTGNEQNLLFLFFYTKLICRWCQMTSNFFWALRQLESPLKKRKKICGQIYQKWYKNIFFSSFALLKSYFCSLSHEAQAPIFELQKKTRTDLKFSQKYLHTCGARFLILNLTCRNIEK